MARTSSQYRLELTEDARAYFSYHFIHKDGCVTVGVNVSDNASTYLLDLCGPIHVLLAVLSRAYAEAAVAAREIAKKSAERAEVSVNAS